MPLGNRDIGINLWVEENGDLQFYISKTDSYSEYQQLLKLGRVRVRFAHHPFKAGTPFRHILDIQKGTITIEAGEPAGSSIGYPCRGHDPSRALAHGDPRGDKTCGGTLLHGAESRVRENI